jgi:endonuclease V-like protein UPF0215 family
MNLDFNRMTNSLESTQTDHTQRLRAAKLISESLSKSSKHVYMAVVGIKLSSYKNSSYRYF